MTLLCRIKGSINPGREDRPQRAKTSIQIWAQLGTTAENEVGFEVHGEECNYGRRLDWSSRSIRQEGPEKLRRCSKPLAFFKKRCSEYPMQS